MLGHLLHLNGIDSVIVENRSREYVIDRVRAGVLEQGTVDLLIAMGVGARLQRLGLRHEGLYVSFEGRRHRIDLAELTGGKAITVYGQNEVVHDLIDARIATLQEEIAADEDALKGFLAVTTPQDPAEIAYDSSFREVAERLPKRLAELRSLQSERAQLDTQ